MISLMQTARFLFSAVAKCALAVVLCSVTARTALASGSTHGSEPANKTTSQSAAVTAPKLPPSAEPLTLKPMERTNQTTAPVTAAPESVQVNFVTNHIDPTPAIPTLALGFSLSNATPAKAGDEWTNTPAVPAAPAGVVVDFQHRLDAARYLRNTQRGRDAIPMFVELLGEKSPEPIRKAALLELAAAAQDENNLVRAQQIYAQYAQKWPDDQYIPEVLLRQGHIFREQGLNKMALAKYYAVMTSALVLRHDQFDYYARLVIEAQTQIAETHFRIEKFVEAGDYYRRLLKQDSPFINRTEAQFKLVNCLVQTAKYEEAVTLGLDFLERYPTAAEQPEVRFHLAAALKQLGRNNESLLQVLSLLREQSARAKANPEVWAYWQQRTGNLIANQLFREGDFARALEIYLGLIRLDKSPAWQLPLSYQIGMTYEKLWQPQKAIETYSEIISREKELAANSTPGLKAVVEMARWRVGFVQWQTKAEGFNHAFHATNAPAIASMTENKAP